MKKRITNLFVLAAFLLPASVLAQNLDQARKMFYYERWKSARAGFEQAAAANPDAAYWLVETLLQSGDLAGARTAAQTAVGAFSSNPLVLVAMGHVELYEGKSGDAKNRFEAAISMADKKSKAAVLNAVGRAHGNVPLKNSVPDYGIDKLKQALQLDARNGSIYINLGDCYRKKLDGGEAVQAYTTAMQNDAGLTAQANYKIGRVYATQQNCEVFTRYFNNATSADANFMPAWRELYDNYSDRENKCANFELAKTYFEKYLGTNDQGDETEMLRANFAFVSKDYNMAIQKAQGLMTSMGAKAPVRLNKLIGYSYYEMKDYANTITWMEKYFAAETDVDNIVTHNYRVTALSYDALGQFEKAKQTWVKAGDFEPDVAKKWFYFSQAADVAEKMKDNAGAVAIYQMVLDKKPNPTKNDFLKCGTAYYNMEDHANSIKVYERYSEKFTDDWRGPLWLGRNNSHIDSNLTTGAAAPFYEKAITLAMPDTNANWVQIEANRYLFAYNYNFKKDKAAALANLDRILVLEPGNADAIKFATSPYHTRRQQYGYQTGYRNQARNRH